MKKKTTSHTKAKTKALARSTPTQLSFTLPGASATALSLPEGLTFQGWTRVVDSIRMVGTAARWWVGDCFHYGEAHFGEEYAQATSGYDPDDLARVIRVALRVAPERRRTDLSWSHHAEVARLEDADQMAWLARAAKEHWTAKELRAVIKSTTDKPASGGGNGKGMTCCPGCNCEGAKKTSICCKPRELPAAMVEVRPPEIDERPDDDGPSAYF